MTSMYGVCSRGLALTSIIAALWCMEHDPICTPAFWTSLAVLLVCGYLLILHAPERIVRPKAGDIQRIIASIDRYERAVREWREKTLN